MVKDVFKYISVESECFVLGDTNLLRLRLKLNFDRKFILHLKKSTQRVRKPEGKGVKQLCTVWGINVYSTMIINPVVIE